MLTVDEALALVLEHAVSLPAVELPAAETLGLVLAEEVTSDIDSPPHDKSAVDGYALHADDLSSGTAELVVVEEVMAGGVPQRVVERGQATRIMTGAPIPSGANAVVMVERTEILGLESQSNRVRIVDAPPRAGQNIIPRGCSLHAGDVVLKPGQTLRAIELGLLAEVGRTRVCVTPQPKVAILSTGNEIVPANQVPAPGQIRNSNGPMLAASVRSAGAVPLELGIARDEPTPLQDAIQRGLGADVLILSGGVSAGLLDLVPATLDRLGVHEVFHKVQLKPGKPLWFGVLPPTSHRPAKTLVFGLPGNPVSSLVCFEVFVRPALDRLTGRKPTIRTTSARLAAEFRHRGDRPTYHPAIVTLSAGEACATPLRWAGSADLFALASANALICFPAGDRTYAVGETITIHSL